MSKGLAAGRFRLSRLLRGRRGSEWAMASHDVGEDFVLLDTRSVKPIPLPVEMLGSTVTVTAHGPGDSPNAPSASRAANGEAMRPLSPAHLKAVAMAGALVVSWVRRSRLSWGWIDEIEAPADGGVQGFRLKAIGIEGSIERDVVETQASLSAPEISALGGWPINIEVRQIGSFAVSRPATITIDA